MCSRLHILKIATAVSPSHMLFCFIESRPDLVTCLYQVGEVRSDAIWHPQTGSEKSMQLLPRNSYSQINLS